MNKKTAYKWCFVPQCKSTTIKTPDKVFFFMPQDVKLRKMWFTSARRADEPGKSNYYCCQDHFDLKNDMDNYVRYSLMGAPRKLKSGVIPHIFDCQPGRLKTSVNLSRPTFVKLNRKRTVAEMLSNTDSEKENSCQSTHSSKKQAVEDNATLNNPAKRTCTDLANRASTSYEVFVNKSSRSKEESNSEEDILEATANFSYTQNLASSSSDISHAYTYTVTTNTDTNSKKTSVLGFGESSDCLLPKSIGKKTVLQKSIGVQVYQKLVKPHVRSKATMCVPSTSDASCQCKIEDKTTNSVPSTSSVSHSTSDYKISSGPSEYQQSTSCSEEEKEKNKQMKINVMNMTRYFISIDPKKYIGIGTEWLWIIDLIHSYIKCSIDDIKLTLMKIKTDDSFSRLGNEFGLSTSQASRVFNKTVNLISQCLKKLVYCPSPEHIKKNLPIAFRAYYSNVCAIIDAFEIEIEKPSTSVQQALTWSDYKKCNTLKYLIACTPDGFILFVSSGYGGRISDTTLFQESNIMDILPTKCGVMADRGFKLIQTILNQKQCELLRPPTVSTSSKPTKEEVLNTKRIASLRIHVERVIRRVREYKILEPHSCLDLNIMSYIDDIVTIVAGLINLQTPIIKT